MSGSVARAEARAWILVITVNIVSAVPPEVWEREVPPGLPVEFVHTREPVAADWHVIYGLREKLIVPNSPRRVLFVASEPPEIREYSAQVLSRYERVLGPEFPYLQQLPHYVYGAGLAPWWVGVVSRGADHYDGHEGPLALTREALGAVTPPFKDSLSVIVSTKARTPLQVARLRLVEYLSQHLASLEVFGVGHSPVDDKATVLSEHRYHLAVENSEHRGYWTEKLTDPLLMGCAVFYGGHPSVAETFPHKGIHRINVYDPEGVYREISAAIDGDLWAMSAGGIALNREVVLQNSGLHRAVAAALPLTTGGGAVRARYRIPAHHPVAPWKNLTDPLYRRLSFRRN